MRMATFAGVVLIVAGLSVSAVGTTNVGTSSTRHKQSAIVHFTNPTLVAGRVLAEGEYLIVHDDDRMTLGQACTTVFCFDSERGWTEAVSFHCRPVEREKVERTSLTFVSATPEERAGGAAVDKLLEYQFAGDTEGHGVPDDRLAGILRLTGGHAKSASGSLLNR